MVKFSPESKSLTAQQNMEQDYRQLCELSSISNPTLHFHQWRKESVTYGYFTSPEKWVNVQSIEKLEWDIARRPTGGGIIFHGYDLSFAIIIPAHYSGFSINTLENYTYINSKVAQAITAATGLKLNYFPCSCKRLPTFCMAQPTPFDLMIDGKKVAGAAQRRIKHGYLHQGSICLTLPSKNLLNEVLLDQNFAKDMLDCSYPLANKLNMDKEHLTKTLQESIKIAFS